MTTGRRREQRLVTTCYWAFTLSDGALRMLVLLHLHDLGTTPLALALVLLPYEVAGLFTNLLGGWLGTRFGLKCTLLLGLSLQGIACALLAVEAAQLTVPYVMGTQVLSGIAKDLAKTGAKSFVRQLAPQASATQLFGLVAVLTGSKNAMKGLGFFVGGALLATVGFRDTNWLFAGLLALMAVAALVWLPPAVGRPQASWRAVFGHSRAVHWLAAARAFLFGSRDVWFVVALPLFLTSSLHWSPGVVGGCLSAWVIGYGIVQALAPRLVRPTSTATGVTQTAAITLLLVAPLLGLVEALRLGLAPSLVIAVGLATYGALFAITSSLHSWLVVALAGAENVAERVGFYYAANAAGRLAGTFASGWVYANWGQGTAGLVACLWVAAGAVGLAAACTWPVRRNA